jgi:hypothetical protein
MGKITRLPAHNCVFFRSGHCLYEETQNPGLNPQMQCLVLTELEKKYDHLLNQAEVFSLNSLEVRKIWARRFGDDVSWENFCNVYESRNDGDDRCRLLYGNACLLLLPACPGICSLYVANRPKKRC